VACRKLGEVEFGGATQASASAVETVTCACARLILREGSTRGMYTLCVCVDGPPPPPPVGDVRAAGAGLGSLHEPWRPFTVMPRPNVPVLGTVTL
jgi:hypothetical protein